MLIEKTLFGTIDRVQVAIDRLKHFEPDDGYYLAFSGGKDSVVIKALADMAGVKYDAHYNYTTVDPPELVRFIKQQHADVEISHPKMTMFQLIEKKMMPPTRIVRYCCEYLKERGGDGRTVMTGVRWAESARRNSRMMIESCSRKKGKTLLHPIIDWSDSDVWEFIKGNDIPYCSLYDEGFTRLGCVGCPLSGPANMLSEFKRWPKFEKAYRNTFNKIAVTGRAAGRKLSWPDGDAVFDWWTSDINCKKSEAQNVLFD